MTTSGTPAAGKPPAKTPQLRHEREDIQHAADAVAVIVGRLQPDVMHALELLLQDAAGQLGLLDAQMRARGPHDRDAMPQPDPLPGQVVRAIFHAVLGRAGIVVDDEYVHADWSPWTVSSHRPRAASSSLHNAANLGLSLPASRLLQRGIAMTVAKHGR